MSSSTISTPDRNPAHNATCRREPANVSGGAGLSRQTITPATGSRRKPVTFDRQCKARLDLIGIHLANAPSTLHETQPNDDLIASMISDFRRGLKSWDLSALAARPAPKRDDKNPGDLRESLPDWPQVEIVPGAGAYEAASADMGAGLADRMTVGSRS